MSSSFLEKNDSEANNKRQAYQAANPVHLFQCAIMGIALTFTFELCYVNILSSDKMEA